jgi:membrane fusion protein, multidrug efflux system
MSDGNKSPRTGGDSGQQAPQQGGQGGEPAQASGPKQGNGQNKGGGRGSSKRSYRFLWIFGAVLLVAGLGVFLYHLLVGRYHVTTQDAYVSGDLIRLAPQVSGTVIDIAADETQYVRQGQLLVQLDAHDADVVLLQAKANLAQTVREVAQLFDAERQAEAVLAAQQSQLQLADQTLRRDRGLVGAHGVSQQDIERDEENQRNAQAGTRQAAAALASVQAAIAGTQPDTHPRVLLAEANLRSAWLAKTRTQVLAPVSGYILRRTVQLGQEVNPGTDMLAMAPLQSVWIDANLKETQLEEVRIGQPVSVTTDIYGSHYRYHGRVLGLTGGTGAALAVLPPENATGNWIKIVQRLPVRIGLDPQELRDHPLFLGLSMSVNVDVHDMNGASLSQRPAWPASLRTHVYASQDAGVEDEIRRLVTENLGGSQPPAPTAKVLP